MKELNEYLGAFYGWSWSEYEGCYIWRLFYWPRLYFKRMFTQYVGRVIKGIWSGFMSEARGLSWDRKSRYGLR